MTLTGKMHLKASQTQAETLHPQAEQGLERVVEVPKMVKSLIKVFFAYIKVTACFLLLGYLHREFPKYFLCSILEVC